MCMELILSVNSACIHVCLGWIVPALTLVEKQQGCSCHPPEWGVIHWRISYFRTVWCCLVGRGVSLTPLSHTHMGYSSGCAISS
jgi:hypothetical protein